MNKAVIVFLITTAVAAAQNPTPTGQARQIELQKKAMRSAARSARVKILGSPTLVPLHPVRIIPPLKKMENK